MSSSDSDDPSSSSVVPKQKQKISKHPKNEDLDSDSSSSSSDDETDIEDTPEEPVLSHKEKRKQKKKELDSTKPNEVSSNSTKSKKNSADLHPSKQPKRQNSVWVGNLTFQTTDEMLRKFFYGVGEITRIHMPMKAVNAGPGAKGNLRENRGFAYVDFATPEAKAEAIAMSENMLDGRRLLIKDGSDFTGRPSTSTTKPEDEVGEGKSKPTGMSKTAQKILRVQKQPAGPTLFFGNLGFETTVETLRGLLERNHATHNKTDSTEGGDKDEKWLRKIRMGTFEDSGKCKGWAFVDFTNVEHATTALTNIRNHHLDGRELVVEYASPDAVRRGGFGPRPERAAGDFKSGDRPQRRPQKREREAARNNADSMHVDGESKFDAPEEKRRRTDSRGDRPRKDFSGKRAKPGAALAMAKRQDVSIVPSEGKKIVFD
ncbi:hypothetical protein ABKN59_000599 [Abortiporus biennis]